MSNHALYQLQSPEEVALGLAERTRALRLARRWKQRTLAERSGVSLASLRRFERTGEISFRSLLRLSFALGRLDDFEDLLRPPAAASIADLEARTAQPKAKRGTQ